MFTLYALIWATLATLSLFYLVLLATQPTLVAHYLGSGGRTAQADAEATQRMIHETAAEVRTLRDTIDLFRNELIEMRTQISSQSDTARDLAARLATLEAEPAEPQRTAKDAKKTKAAEQAEAAPAQKAAKKAAAKKSDTDLETGSVAQPGAAAAPITFGPPTVTPAAATPPPPPEGPVGVQIATGPSLDSMRLNWTLLSARHADSFRALEPRYTIDMSGSGETYNLIVGPLGSVDEARRLCQDLAAKATPCSVSRFSGGAL